MEGANETIVKYYFTTAGRTAMRVNGVLTWLMVDQVGSTSVTSDINGALGDTVKYSAFGEIRAGGTATDYLYTSQRNEAEIGLDFYVSRFYDPVTAHFIQADTIVPEAGSSKAYDRYGYVLWNPINFNDPSGHMVSCDQEAGLGCGSDGTIPYILDKYKQNKLDGTKVYWNGLRDSEKKALTGRGYNNGVYEDAVINGGVKSVAGTIHDPVMWAISLLPAAKGAQLAVNGIRGVITVASTAGTNIAVGNLLKTSIPRAITNSQITGSKGNILNITGFQQTTINGITYSGHAVDRLLQHGIPPSVVEGVMEYEPIVGNSAITQVFYDPVNNIRIVQNMVTGIIVTLGYGKP